MNKKHTQEHKNLVINEENQGWTLSSVDCKESDIRFDGITRVVALSPRKLLLLLEKGSTLVMNLLFDQAEIDVAEAQFTPVKCDQPTLASSIALIDLPTKPFPSFKVFVSSFYTNQSFF